MTSCGTTRVLFGLLEGQQLTQYRTAETKLYLLNVQPFYFFYYLILTIASALQLLFELHLLIISPTG